MYHRSHDGDRQIHLQRDILRHQYTSVWNLSHLLNNHGRLEPADLEELMRQKTAVEAQELKPKFLSKSERRELAIKNREEQAKLIKAQIEAERNQRITFFSEADKERRERERERERERDRERPREHSRERITHKVREPSPIREEREEKRRRTSSPHREEKDDDRKKREEDREKKKIERAKDKEREEIKKFYMGIKEKKRRFVKPSEKFKFVFEWDLSEDTSRDYNPLYNNPYLCLLIIHFHGVFCSVKSSLD